MIDEKAWNVIVEILSVIDHSRRPNDPNTDAIAHIHVILFGDLLPLIYIDGVAWAWRVPTII